MGFATKAGADLNFGPDTDKLCQSAWLLYEQGDLDKAIAIAHDARECAGQPLQVSNCCAALGWFLIEKGDLAAAEDVLLPALASAPHQAILQWRVGALQHKKGNLDQAIHHLESALAIDPSLDEAAASLAWMLHDQGRLAEACVWVRHALARRATPERQTQLGWFSLLQDKAAEAIPLFQESLNHAPHMEKTYVHLGRALSEVGMGAQALQVLTDALARFPQSPDLMLAIAWQHRGAQEFSRVRPIAQQVIAMQPHCASAWLLLGLAERGLGNTEVAAKHFRRALELDASSVHAAIPLASYLRDRHRFAEALATVCDALRHHGDHAELRELQAQLTLDVGDIALARRHVHKLLAKDRINGRLWHMLAMTLQKRNRISIATAAVHRALRYLPYSAESWELAAWLAIADGRLDEARLALKQLVKRCPGLPDLDVHAAFILTACGDLCEAAAHADAAVARQPQSPQALRALGHLRHRQGHLREAARLTRRALACDPEFAAPYLRQLGWIQRACGQLADAADTFQHACDLDVSDAICVCECAETQALGGNLEKALVILQRAREIQPSEPKVQLLHAQLLRDSGPSSWSQAIAVCAELLRNHTLVQGATFALMGIAAQGIVPAQQALRMLKRSERLKHYQSCLESTQASGSNPEYVALSRLALHEFPDDVFVKTAALCAQGTADATGVSELARQTREWGRYLAMRAGACQYTAHRPDLQKVGRLRIAYVAAHFHQSLLMRVLTAHNFDAVDVFLYCDVPIESLGELAGNVFLHALHGQDLVASMRANQIDVAIDTVGVGPFLGQDAVLLQFARRVAPVQCAWLGSWASGGGIFDFLLSDAYAAPEANDWLYEEGIVRLTGGQWCWEPPACAPAISPPPHLESGVVTLGCAVRAFRISARAIQVWVRLLVRLPNAKLLLMGAHGQNARFRLELHTALTAAGLEPGRVAFQAQCAYRDYLASYSAVDIALDSFPANGGLCLLDALWMGVPVVSLAGSLLGERQGLSILGSIGRNEWVATDENGYVDLVCALASDSQGLTNVRERLRTDMAASSLLNGRRVAGEIEAHCERWRQVARDTTDAPTPKERVRAVAQRQLDTWLSRGSRLYLASPTVGQPPVIDVSVVVVLFNQAGLSRQTLSALADQTGVVFETIVVDNASGADIGHLLGRVDGARIVRNTNNAGFLLAANQGAALATGRHILFLNSDAILHTHALRNAVDRLDSDLHIGAVGARIVLADGTLQEAGCITYAGGPTTGYGRGQDPYLPEFSFVRAVDFCSGAFLMVRRSLWLKLGGFDPAFAPAYYEDSDLCLRIQDAGCQVIYDPQVWVSHFEWGSAVSNHDAIVMMERNCQRFSARHLERLADRPDPAHASPHLDRWRSLRKTRILIIDNGVPHSAAGGGLPRARLIVQALSDNDLTLFPMWDIDEDWRDVYASVPDTVEAMLDIGAAGLEAFLEQRTGVYDFVMVSRPPNMALVDALRTKRPLLFSGMRVVYDAEALFALREVGKAALRGSAMPTDIGQQLLQKELALAQRADTVISVSDHEARTIRAAGVAQVHILSHAMETRTDTPDWSQRENLLFVGAIHPDTPNEDSLLWFCREIMPILREQHALDLSLDIVGDCSSRPVQALADKHIRLLGRVEYLVPYYDQHRVFIAPTRFAAGIPAKVIEAACNGIPVVATPLLASQLDWQAEHEILTADDPQAFAGAIASLYTDPVRWQRLRAAMLDRTRVLYAPEQFSNTLRNIFVRP